MRITFITTHFPPSIGFGGVCTSSYGLSRALAKIGIVIDVITSDSTKGYRVPFSDFSTLEKRNFHIHPFKYLVSEKSCFSFDVLKVLNNFVPKSDLIYVNGIFTHPVSMGALVSRFYKKPYVVSLRNGLDPWLFKIKTAKKKAAFNMYVKSILNKANCIHVTTEKEIQHCRVFKINKPFTIIGNGIDSELYQNIPSSIVAEDTWPILKGKTVVLFLSRLSPQKGLDMLIPAWDKIIRTNPEAFLIIAGPDYSGFSKKIKKLVDRSSFPETVLLTGDVEGDTKLSLFARSDVFVLPSYSENFGNVIAEALACGTPVVTTHATPWKQIDKVNCGHWIPVNKDALVKALTDLINKTSYERKKMGQIGRNLILQEFTWDNAARKMLKVYQSILENKSIPLNPII